MTELHDIESIQNDIPIEIFVSSCSEDTPEMPPKRTRGKPRVETASWRYREAGTYDNRPNDKYYFNKYMAVRNMCTCGRMVAVGDRSRHRKTRVCMELFAIRQNNS